MRKWNETGVVMVGPAIFHAEVTSVIRKHVYFKRILPDEGEEAFSLSSGMEIGILDGPEIRKRAWQLAKEFNLPVCYDMHYLAVAELEDCELWTTDRKLVGLSRGKNRRVRWVGEYPGQ
jgi:predicted nucleic acid-binding protein